MKKVQLNILLVLCCFFNIRGFSQDTILLSPDLELVKISANSWLHVSYASLPDYGRISANGLIFTEGNEAFLFDTPWNDSLTLILVSWLRDNMKLKISGFIPNHWHEDCIGGLGYLKSQKIKSYANHLTIDIAKTNKLSAPEIGFHDSLELHLGNKSIYCYYPGAAHSKDNIVVWIPSEKILFPGCMCKSLNSPNLGNTSDGDVTAYKSTIQKVRNKFKSAEIVIPGHGKAGGKELLSHTESLIHAIYP